MWARYAVSVLITRQESNVADPRLVETDQLFPWFPLCPLTIVSGFLLSVDVQGVKQQHDCQGQVGTRSSPVCSCLERPQVLKFFFFFRTSHFSKKMRLQHITGVLNSQTSTLVTPILCVLEVCFFVAAFKTRVLFLVRARRSRAALWSHVCIVVVVEDPTTPPADLSPLAS